MLSRKQLKLAEKALGQQLEVVRELEDMVKSIQRCERTVAGLKDELERVNAAHQDRKTTEEDIAFLEEMLKCARNKLNWERQLTSLRKRTPPLMEKIEQVLRDAENPPSVEIRNRMLEILQEVQKAMERLESAAGK